MPKTPKPGAVGKLYAVGKQTNAEDRGDGQWQACLVVADTESEAIARADKCFGQGWWSEHLDPPTVVLVAEHIRMAPGMPKAFLLDSLDERKIFPKNVPTKMPRLI